MALQFLLVPVTLHYLGSQAYGLIGIYATFLAMIAIFELGLTAALTRELSKLSASQDGDRLMRPTVTTLEVICVGIAAGIALAMWLASPLLAKYWFTNSNLPVDLLRNCLQWLGVQSAFQFMTSYYNSGLMGIQRIVLSNGVGAFCQTLRTVILVCLLMIHPDIEAYFICQAATGFITLVATACALYVALPKRKADEITTRLDQPQMRWCTSRYKHERFMSCRQYAGGMTATALSTLLLTQLDKIILGKMLSLEQFGYYTIASGIANMLTKPAGLILGAALPRMTQLAMKADTSPLTQIYFKSSSLVSWVVLPAAGILIGFSEPLLNLYLRDPASAAQIAPLAAALAVGNALHGISFIPYGLTLAYGWTRFGVNFGLVGSLILLPFIVLATMNYGALGAASVWGVLCLSYVTIFMAVIHRKYLQGLLPSWYKRVCLWQGVAFLALIFLGLIVRQP